MAAMVVQGSGAARFGEDRADSRRRGRILVIDDDVTHLGLVGRILRRHEVIPVVQGSLGLDLALAQRPDLIVTDADLPNVPGEAMLGRLQEQRVTAGIPVIVMGAEVRRSRRRRLLEAGACACLAKPLDVRLFLETVEDVLYGRGSETVADTCGFCGRSPEPGTPFLRVVVLLHVAEYEGIVQPPTVIKAGVFCRKPCIDGGAAETIAAGLADWRVERCFESRQPGDGLTAGDLDGGRAESALTLLAGEP